MSATDAPAPVRPNRGVAARVEWERRTNSFTQLAQQVRAGHPVDGLFPMNAEWRARYDAWRRKN